MKDSLKVTQKEDGSFDIEWDETDLKYAFLSTLTEEQLSAIIIRNLEYAIQHGQKHE
jgi:hypothetical protein